MPAEKCPIGKDFTMRVTINGEEVAEARLDAESCAIVVEVPVPPGKDARAYCSEMARQVAKEVGAQASWELRGGVCRLRVDLRSLAGAAR